MVFPVSTFSTLSIPLAKQWSLFIWLIALVTPAYIDTSEDLVLETQTQKSMWHLSVWCELSHSVWYRFPFDLFALGNYNITTTFPPSFPSLPALLYNPLHCPSNSRPLFSFIVMACIYVYTDIFLNITLVHIMLLLNVSSELTIFLGKDCLYSSQHSSVSHSSLSRAEALWAFPCALCPLGFILIQLMFRQSCWWDSMDVASDSIRKRSHSTLPDLLLLQSFCSLIQNVP